MLDTIREPKKEAQMKRKKVPSVRLNTRISEKLMNLLTRKANRRYDGNISAAARDAIALFLLEK